MVKNNARKKARVRPSGRKTGSRKKLFAIIISAVPLLGLLWGIFTYLYPRKEVKPASLQFKYFLFKADALTDFAEGSPELLKILRIRRPLISQADLAKRVLAESSRVAIQRNGRRVLDAMFLAISNVGEQQARKVILEGKKDVPDLGFFNPGETSLFCVKARFLGGKSVAEPITEVLFIGPRGEQEAYTLEGIPDEKLMQVVLGKQDGVVLLGYPPKVGRQKNE